MRHYSLNQIFKITSSFYDIIIPYLLANVDGLSTAPIRSSLDNV